MKTIIIIFSFVILVYFISCDTNEPPSPPSNGEKPTLELKLEDASCLEVWIELTTTNLQLPATFTLKQFNPAGDTISQILNLATQDSVLYIDSLMPKQTYQYQVSSIEHQVTSNELSVTTMDTTSHDFTFETFTFGGNAGSCALYDVAIINENNIWAVGEINIADTSINGYTTYGAVHWDGQVWELKKLFYNTNIPVTPRGIFVISPTEIYLASGSIFRWDGSSSTVQLVYSRLNLPDPNATIEKLWGSSGSSIYGVGNVGTIVHYNGTLWNRIESGTELDFHDVYGATDPKTGEQQILAVCSRNLPLDKGIYKIEGNTAVEISSSPIQWELYALWFIPNRHYYVIGNGIYEKKSLTDPAWKDNGFDITHYATTGIRGTDLNDVFIAGAFGEFLHFNGISWKSYINETGWFSGSYGGIAVKNNLVVTVGYEGAQAKILKGYRN